MDGRFASLEAALAAAWDRETLAVYADLLADRGDPRGELIAIDLQLERAATPELVARRASLLGSWLGDLVPHDPHTSWIGDSFRFGFVENLVLDAGDRALAAHLEAMLASPLAPYLRRVSIRGDRDHAPRVFESLARREHAWLAALAVHSWSYEEPIEPRAVTALIAATPRLERLELRGARILARGFAHPAVRTLVVTGWSALPALFEDGAGEPPTGTVRLELAFHPPRDPERFVPATPDLAVPALRLPRLAQLDLARNEPEDQAWPGIEWDEAYDEAAEPANGAARFDVLDFIAAQPRRAHLTHLRLPSIRSREDWRRLDALAGQLDALEEIELARGHYYACPPLARSSARLRCPPPWPWPRPDDAATTRVHVVPPGSRSGERLAIAELARVMELQFEQLDAPARDAWTRFWTVLAELTEARPFPAGVLLDALEACDLGLAPVWRELRDELRYRRPFPAGAIAKLEP